MTAETKVMPLPSACALSTCMALLHRAYRSKASFAMVTLPASILEKSSTSSTRPSMAREEASTVLTISACSTLSGVSRRSSSMPMIAFSGVLIS